MTRSGCRGELGSGALDLVFAVTIMMVFLGLVVAFGQILYGDGQITDAARDGAEAAVVAQTAGEAQTQAKAVVQSTLAPMGCKTLNVDVDTTNFGPGGSVTVTVSCSFEPVDSSFAGIPPTFKVTRSESAPMESFRNG